MNPSRRPNRDLFMTVQQSSGIRVIIVLKVRNTLLFCRHVQRRISRDEDDDRIRIVRANS